jgi:kinesin family protein 5
MSSTPSTNNIKVICRHVLAIFSAIPCSLISRFRPPNSLEIREGGEIVVSFDDNLQTVKVRSASQSQGPEKDGFTFDRVFPMGTKQHEVFDYGVRG